MAEHNHWEKQDSTKNNDEQIVSIKETDGHFVNYYLDGENRLLKGIRYNKKGELTEFVDFTKALKPNETRKVIFDPVKKVVISDIIVDSNGNIKELNATRALEALLNQTMSKDSNHA